MVALIIPTLNEAEAIGSVIAEVSRTWVDRVVVADSGSHDGTPEIAAAAGAEVIAVGRGYGRACLAAAKAVGDAEILVFMDGDGADDPRSLARFIQPVVSGEADFVIGSRVRGKAAKGSLGWHQRLAGRLLGAAIGFLYGVGYTDMCAYRAIRRERLLALDLREAGSGWNLEMQMRVAGAGLRVLELPVDNRARRGGKSKVAGTFGGTIRTASRLLIVFLRLAFGQASRPVAHSFRAVEHV